jgi:transposase-like protein
VTAGDASPAGGRVRHVPVFHCPFCGDEELVPHGDTADGWRCAACLRSFTVRLTGTGVTGA